MKITHPACGKQFPSGNRAGHCSGCCETFIGLAAFERHRVGGHNVDRRCATLVDGEGGYWLDEAGHWHHGPKLTDEQKAKLWPADDAEAEQ